jgi:hypothetical protein
MPHAVSALKAVLQLERSHVGDMSFSVASIRPNTGSGRAAGAGGMVTAAGMLGAIAAAARVVPAPMALATAAVARKRRRVGSRGGNIMAWAIADVFMGGVLSTLSAWDIWVRSPPPSRARVEGEREIAA